MKIDAERRRDVMVELAWDPAVLATDVGVTVRDGLVAAVAWAAPGVHAIVDELRVA